MNFFCVERKIKLWNLKWGWEKNDWKNCGIKKLWKVEG